MRSFFESKEICLRVILGQTEVVAVVFVSEYTGEKNILIGVILVKSFGKEGNQLSVIFMR